MNNTSIWNWNNMMRNITRFFEISDNKGRLHRKNYPIANLTEQKYKFSHSTPKELVNSVSSLPPVSFLIVNEFLEKYKEHSNDNNIAPNVPKVDRDTVVKDYIMRNGHTVNNLIIEHMNDGKVNNYNHTKILFDLYNASCNPSSLVYDNVGFGSSRYFFFPEYGISGDLHLATPEFLMAAIEYERGNKEFTASVDYKFKNSVAYHFSNSGGIAYSHESFIWIGLREFSINFNGDMKYFNNKTIEDLNNILFAYNDKKFLYASSGSLEVAKHYLLAELIDFSNEFIGFFDLNDNIVAYLSDNNNFEDNNYRNMKDEELKEVINGGVKSSLEIPAFIHASDNS